ncbi:PLP-dependent cysteine synthase family protein [Nafulsella turpanensis]|uniref:PLP-dependent cysteine synthase family protein n=1 Tax=Nafulsella turpanensis TaxID=1265690 RepID=UPI00034D7BA0|nr:cysteine synthase family protein [Nafulsella turpanensis]
METQEIIQYADKVLEDKFYRLGFLIGNTPMLELRYCYKGKPGSIFVKCEQYNLSGSIKDRMALRILEKAWRRGHLKPGDTIVEATSGNSGIAFAAVGQALGHPVKVVMPNWLTRERAVLMEAMGATVRLVSREEGGFMRSIQLATEMGAMDPNVFLPRQFENADNVQAHAQTTGPEIVAQLSRLGRLPDAFVAGVGTGGTVMGVGSYLRSVNPEVRIHPLEPAESPTLSTGRKCGFHRIQGISDEFIPPIVRLDELAPVVQAQEEDAILMAQKLAARLGLGVGFSSGANVVGAIRLQQELGQDSTVVTVLPDSNKKYLSTDLLWEHSSREGYVTPEVEFRDYVPIARLA